ncbi:major facilitator superfamily domain-containing protein [Syncephalis plumigaleata]|nr:major facilitator superfamily domain-containing protein [Syncephalis plumigaleata]
MWSRVLQAINVYEANRSLESETTRDTASNSSAVAAISSEMVNSDNRSNITVYVSAEEISMPEDEITHTDTSGVAMSLDDASTSRDHDNVEQPSEDIIKVSTLATNPMPTAIKPRYPSALYLSSSIPSSSDTLHKEASVRKVTFSLDPPPVHTTRRISEYEKYDERTAMKNDSSHNDNGNDADTWSHDLPHDWQSTHRRDTRQRRTSSQSSQNTDIVVRTWRHALVLVGMLVALLAVTMDSLTIPIIAPAMVLHYKSFDKMIWFIAAYLLAYAMGQPIAHQLAVNSSQARRSLMLSALVLFIVSTVSTLFVSTFNALTMTRTITGLSAGIITCLSRDAMLEHIASKYNGFIQRIVTITRVLATLIGPLLGGALTESLGWFAFFYVTISLGGVALVLLALLPRRRRTTTELRESMQMSNLSVWCRVSRAMKRNTSGIINTIKQARVDLLGAVLLSATILLFLQGTAWGGRVYTWFSPTVISFYSGAVAMLVIFLLVEWRWSKHPLVNPSKRWTHNLYIGWLLNFNTGAIYVAILYYLPIWLQTTYATSSLDTGFWMLPLFVTALITSAGTKWLLNRRETRLARRANQQSVSYHRSCFHRNSIDPAVITLIMGQLLMAIGLGMLGLPANIPRNLSNDSLANPPMHVVVYIAMVGCGIGFTIQPTLVAVKRNSIHHAANVTTQTLMLARHLGGVVGMAVASSVFANVFHYHLQNVLASSGSLLSIKDLEGDPKLLSLETDATIQLQLTRSLAMAARWCFLALAPFSAVNFLASWLIVDQSGSVHGMNDTALSSHSKYHHHHHRSSSFDDIHEVSPTIIKTILSQCTH